MGCVGESSDAADAVANQLAGANVTLPRAPEAIAAEWIKFLRVNGFGTCFDMGTMRSGKKLTTVNRQIDSDILTELTSEGLRENMPARFRGRTLSKNGIGIILYCLEKPVRRNGFDREIKGTL